MTEETQIPECCIKYDEIENKISELNSEIEYLENEVEPKTATLKEYLQIVKDAKTIGLTPALVHYAIEDPVAYYRMRIAEINEELLKNDVKIKDSKNELEQLEKEFECIREDVSKTGYVKIRVGLFDWACEIKWVSSEEFESVKGGKVWFRRLS